MEQVVFGVKQVTNIVATISTASDEQRPGIEQINTAIAPWMRPLNKMLLWLRKLLRGKCSAGAGGIVE
jgi:hypothetical protein